MNINLLSTTPKNKYAIRNINQSIENARIYCSYLEGWEFRAELENMIERFKKRIENKINDNF